MNLRLFLLEIFELISFTTSINGLFENGLCNKNNLEIYLLLIKDEFNLLNQKEENEALKVFQKQYNFLFNLLNDKEMFPLMIINIFSYKLKKIQNENYIIKIFEIIINDNRLIEKSKVILNQFLNKYEMEPKSIDIDNTEDNCLDSFCSFANDENNKILKLLNNKQSVILNEILISLFELKIYPYFYPEENEENAPFDFKILGISFKYFQKCVNFLDEYPKYIDKGLNNLKLIYYISYVKCYLYNFVEKNVNKFQQIGNVSNVHDYISESKKPFRTVLKMFILKLFNLSQFKAYHVFLENIQNYGIKWIEEFPLEEKTNICTLDYIFINPEDTSLYIKELGLFDVNSILSDASKILFCQLIKDNMNKFDTFIDLSINKCLTNLVKQNYIQLKEYEDSINFITFIVQQLNLSPETISLINLFFTKEKYLEKMHNQILSFTNEKFEILLYAYKIALLCSLLENKNSFYNKIISNSIINSLNNTFIPGNEPNDSPILTSYPEIVNHLKTFNSSSEAVYVCSCGLWYNVGPCGLPTVITICKCGLEIGGLNHKLVERKGHFRVYLTQEHKNEVELRSYYKPMNSMLLSDFKKNYYDVCKNEQIKGFKKVNNYFFIDSKKEVRNLNNISYRLLSFILHSNIYFSYILGNINNNQIDKYRHNGMTSFDALVTNWNILKDELYNNNEHKIIQVFLNQIFPKLINLLNNYQDLSDKEIRLAFEDYFNNFINTELSKNYNSFSKIYLKKNNELLNVNINSIKKYLQESSDTKIDENNLPLYQYFTVPTYPNEEDLKYQLEKINDSINKYPVLVNYLRCKEFGEIKYLDNLLLMNPFEQFAINYYSYKITRDEAKSKKISDELKIINNKIIVKLYDNFEKGYNNMYYKATQYKCKHYEKKDLRKISKNDSIAYCLNDDGEKECGMHIAAAYHELIRIQNDFLNPILNNISQNGILHYFANQISKEIPIQKATINDVVNFEIASDSYNSLFEILYIFSQRNCIINHNKIDYSFYRNIKYDFKSIEEELGKILLSGKRKFSEEQIFVIYGFEGYHGNKSNIIKEFSDKYIQKPLNIQQKQKLTYLKELNCKSVLFSLQLLIFYLQKENKNASEELRETIKKLPDYIELCEDCKNLPERNNFTIANLIDIYEYIELISYEQIVDNINEFYKKEISEDEKQKITNYFESVKNNKNKIITIEILSNAVRKFISRFLSGKREDTEYKEEEPLLLFIEYKEDIWDKNVFNNDKFNDEIEEMRESFEVHTSQSVEFYEFLNKSENTHILDSSLREINNSENSDNEIDTSSNQLKNKSKKNKNKKLNYWI